MKNNNCRLINICTISIAISVFSSVALGIESSDPEGFQELKWGASSKAIEKKFGNRLSRRKCTDSIKTITKLSGSRCDSYEIKDYRMGRLSFEATFEQDARDGSLRSVILSRQYPISAGTHFAYVASALVDKYGPPHHESDEDIQPGGVGFKGQKSWMFPSTWILLQWARADDANDMLVIQYLPPPTDRAQKGDGI